MKDVLTYCENVKSGKELACIHVKKAVERFERDLKSPEFVFREDKYHKVVDFIGILQHYTGVHDGKQFILEPWQKFIVANLYGFTWKQTGLRRFRSAYLEVARKNGKTALAAALCLYHLLGDGEGGAEVLLAANSKDQAKIGYKHCRGFTKKLDPKEEVLTTFRADILFEQTESVLKVLAADSSKMDGYNCSFGFIDEFHAAINNLVRNVIKSSMAMREQPLLITATTAGFDLTSPCYELRTVATEIIAGIKTDDNFFSIIYTLDDKDDWTDPKVWKKANPNLGVTVNKDFIAQQVLEAQNNPSDEAGVRTKNLNQWLASSDAWLQDKYIIEATREITLEEWEGADVFVGVDLASVQDLTAVAYLFIKEDKYHFNVDYYLPLDGLDTRLDKELYRQWVRSNDLIITPGNVTDYEYITRDIMKIDETCTIHHVAYDPYNATQWAIDATEIGLPLEPYSQTVGNFNKPTREFERLMMSGQVVINDNPATRYCLRNVQLKTDWNGNVKPHKGLSERKKIDGVIAMLQALAMYLEHGIPGAGVY